MKPCNYILVASGAALFAAAPLLAQAAKPASPFPVSRATYTSNIDKAFTQGDLNKDGSLSLAEIAAAEVKASQQIESQMLARKKQAFDSVDTDKNGSISFAEFGVAMKTPKISTDGKAALAQYDTNKDGKVSPSEFRAPSIAKFNAVDTNKDGSVSAAEQEKAGAR